MATTVGKLPEFQQEDGNFEVYLERFEVFTAANDIAEDKKLPIFLTAIGEKAYVTLRSLLLPKTPAKTSFTEVVDVLKKHYAPKRSVVTERYRFYQRKQEPHETVADFRVELKKLAATCEFGAFSTEALRDRLVAGICTEGVRCRLLAMPDEEVTWERACSVAMAMEAATQDTKEMLQTSSKGAAVETEDIYWQRKISQPSKAPSREAPTQSSWDKENGAAKEQTKRMCHRCGGQHSPVSCRFLNSTCYRCTKRGHVAKMCKSELVNRVESEECEKENTNELLSLYNTHHKEGSKCEEIFYFSALNDLPLTPNDVSRETGCDKVLRAVRDMIWHGWPKTVSEQLKPFWLNPYPCPRGKYARIRGSVCI
nr:uncharacterized protein LOC119169744 [Rhipicephalus microplus]